MGQACQDDFERAHGILTDLSRVMVLCSYGKSRSPERILFKNLAVMESQGLFCRLNLFLIISIFFSMSTNYSAQDSGERK